MTKAQIPKRLVVTFFLLLLGLGLVGYIYVVNLKGEQGGNDNQQQSQASPEIDSRARGRFVVGQPAPAFSLETFEGGTVDLATVYGKKAVVVDFWAAWCPFCVAEMPELEKAHQDYGDELLIVGVHRTDTEAVNVGQRFALARGVTYPLVKDSDGSLYRAAGGLGMPVAVFIDREGIVTEVKSGPKTAEEIGEKVRALFN